MLHKHFLFQKPLFLRVVTRCRLGAYSIFKTHSSLLVELIHRRGLITESIPPMNYHHFRRKKDKIEGERLEHPRDLESLDVQTDGMP